MTSARATVAAALLLTLLAGCESHEPAYPTRGVIRFPDGEPVRGGIVEFRHERTGRIAHGAIEHDGRFALRTFAESDGATAGRHKVIVFQSLPPAEPGLEFSRAADHAAHEARFVAPRFADYATSPLSAEVTAEGDNTILLEVEPFTPPSKTGRSARRGPP